MSILPNADAQVTLTGIEEGLKTGEEVLARDGGIAIIVSPPILIDTPHCLEMNLWLSGTHIDVYTVRYVQSMTRE